MLTQIDQSLGVIELRNYLLAPDARDAFIEYFERHFVESQEALNGFPLGQFRIKGSDDRFFWIRGFRDMAARSAFLPAFYGGEVWKERGPAANEMMLTWHDVHLLRPVTPIDKDTFTRDRGLLVVDYYTAKEGKANELIKVLTGSYLPFLTALVSNTSLWVTEQAENDFLRLPVIQDADLLVVITNYRDELDYVATLAQLELGGKDIHENIGQLTRKKETMVLFPTAISNTNLNP